MSSLDTSSEGVSIHRSYTNVLHADIPSTASPSHAVWALFVVSTPLVNAFGGGVSGPKPSTLKVQATGSGELADLVEEFSDGRIQFAFVKVRDPNTQLPKTLLIAWCGDGVPERNKGYFTTHAAAVERVFPSYNVSLTARSEDDVNPDALLRKIADSSGSKYSVSEQAQAAAPPPAPRPAPPAASKPAYTPSRAGPAAPAPTVGGFKPLAGTATRPVPTRPTATDDDGWGADAPPVTRSQLEKVPSSYQPTRVNMSELTKQKTATTDDRPAQPQQQHQPEVVKGGYQPVGKVDIAALRAQAQQQPSDDEDEQESRPKSLAERAAAFKQASNAPPAVKPKITARFGGALRTTGATKPPAPAAPAPASQIQPTITGASRSFADQGGKTPAQLWAEKKARERGEPVPVVTPVPEAGGSAAAAMSPQASGTGQGWKSSYTGKHWGPVQTTHTGGSAGVPVNAQREREEEEERERERESQQQQDEEEEPAPAGVGSIRDRFASAPPPMAARPTPPAPAAPELPMHNKPNAGATGPEPEEEEVRAVPPPPPMASRPVPAPAPVPVPLQTMQQEEEEEEEEEVVRPSSPFRLAIPVSRNAPPSGAEEPQAPPVNLPMRPAQAEAEVEPAPAPAAAAAAGGSGITARAEYDYEKAEDNEIDLAENEIVHDIQKVDEDWWLGTNGKGETGLFPSNYVVEIEGGAAAPAPAPVPAAGAGAPAPAAATGKPTATSMYDYEAAEDNELGFPEGAKIVNVEFPDEDWWFGEYNGKSGLFPANYVELDQ